MSSFINKAKDKIENVLSKDNNQTDNPHSSNEGPHSSNLANKGDPRVDSDRDHRNDPTSRVGGYGDTQTGSGVGGGFGQSDTYGSAGSHPGRDDPRSTNTGPHGSNIMNKADPRVDSDRDGRNDPTSRTGGYGNTQQLGDNYGTAGGPGGLATSDTGYGGSTAGGLGHTGAGHTGHTGVGHTEHSGIGHSGVGHTGHQGHTGHPGQTGLAAATATEYAGTGGAPHTGIHSGTHTTTGGYGTSGYDDPRSANTGPHGSNLGNKLDPRIDSDRDNRNDPTSRVGGYGTQEGYGTGSTGTTGRYGVHEATTTSGYGASTSGIGNEGYRAGGVGSEGYRAGGVGDEGYGAGGAGTGHGDSSHTPGSGKATKTAGPHDSNLLNQLDPRVDSDMDGSKTYGGNQTHR